jgi:gentisate 1,2-dioxygenase
MGSSARLDVALVAALEKADYHPLWTRYKQITPIAPHPDDAPMLWRWRDFCCSPSPHGGGDTLRHSRRRCRDDREWPPL